MPNTWTTDMPSATLLNVLSGALKREFPGKDVRPVTLRIAVFTGLVFVEIRANDRTYATRAKPVRKMSIDRMIADVRAIFERIDRSAPD